MSKTTMTVWSCPSKGEKEEIQQAAKQAGQSVNAYVYEAVKRRMEQEQTTAETADPGVE